MRRGAAVRATEALIAGSDPTIVGLGRRGRRSLAGRRSGSGRCGCARACCADRHRSAAVVADEEDRPAALVGVVPDERAARDRERHLIPVVVDRAAAAAARRARLRGVRAGADRAVGAEAAVEHRPGHADAAQRAAVAADVAGEAAVHDIDGKILVLATARGPPRRRCPGRRLAAVPREHGVDDPQPAAAVEDGASAASVEALAGRVAVHERQVLDDQLGGRLILAVRGRPHLCRIAGVHVEDAVAALSA